MPTDEFAPDLSTLQSDYQILTELRSPANTKRYLARHLELNRDVTITLIRRTDSDDPNMLTRFAADAQMLTTMRHRNVVPVIEGRWITDRVFAIVRARVRGSTLEQLITTTGPMPVTQVGTTLQEVLSAIEWARDNRIAHRHVDADSIVFQQGSGRVLIELDPSSLSGDGVSDGCTDARTIGRLAYEMLSGHRNGDVAVVSLASVRPELSPETVRETEALMRCNRDASSPDARALITLLGGNLEPATAPPSRVRQPAARAVPIRAANDAVVVRQGFGFNARLLTAVAVVAIIAVLGMLLLNRRDTSERRSASSSSALDSSAGEVALPPAKPAPDTIVITGRPMPLTLPMAPPMTNRRMVPADSHSTATPRDPTPPASLESMTAGDSCDSAGADGQYSCLMSAIEQNDRTLNATYRRLIAALRRQAGVQDGDPDPESVTELRAVEARWVDARDEACRGIGEEPLYARVRAQCFAEQSARRTRELQANLATIP